MHPPLLKIFIFLALSLVANARPQTGTGVPSWAVSDVHDWVSSGNYLIYSCLSRASYVQNLLDLTYLYLQTAILSTDTPAYKAFFHTADPAAVTTVLRAITAGANYTTLDYVSCRPTLVCVNDIHPGLRRFWDMCQEYSPDMLLIQVPDSPFTFLCPTFFEQAQSPQPKDCNIVNRAGTRLISYENTASTQYGSLVHALADMYIREKMPGHRIALGDVRDPNECLALSADQALVNPSSYALFAWNIRAGCTMFPSRAPIEPERELLATDGAGNNGTDLLTIGCVSNGTIAGSCSR